MARRLFFVKKQFTATRRAACRRRLFKPSQTLWSEVNQVGSVIEFECDNIAFEVESKVFLSCCVVDEPVNIEQKQEFFDLADKFRDAAEPREVECLGDVLGRMVFGG